MVVYSIHHPKHIGFALFLLYNKSYSVNYCILAQTFTKSMGATGKKMSSFLLTKYTISCFYIFKNNIIKMWEQFRILEFALIIWLILIGQIFLISSSDLVSELSTIVGIDYFSDPFLLAALIPIKIYSNAEADKATIIKENKNKSGIYMWKNLINGKQYIGSAVNLSLLFITLLRLLKIY